MSRVLFAILFFACVTILSGCASDDSRHIDSISDYEDGSRAHPAAYLSDRFQVNHELPGKKHGSTAPFYFKRCASAGERNFYSRTSYDCEYP